MFHSLETTGYQLYNALSDKAWVTLVFILIYSQISQAFKVYLLLLVIYSLIIVFLSKNLIRALAWIFLVATFFPRYKFFSTELNFLTDLTLGKNVGLTFFISFADGILMIFLYFLITRRSKFPNTFEFKFGFLYLLLILISGLVSSIFAKFPLHSFFFIYQLLKGFFILLVYKMLIKKDRFYLKSVMEIIILFVSFNSILILLQAFNGGPLGWPVEGVFGFSKFGDYTDEIFQLYRPGGMTTSPNEMSTVAGMFIPYFLLASLAQKPLLNRTLLILAGLLGFLAVFFSMARAVWVSLALVLLVNIWFIYREEIKIHAPKILSRFKYVLIAGFIILLPFIFLRLWTLQTTFTSKEGGWVYRVRHLEIAYDYMSRLPFGLGLNNFQFKIGTDYPASFYLHDLTPPHSILAQIGASFGFLGLIIWLSFFYLIIRKGTTLIKKYKRSDEILLILASFSSIIMYMLVSQFHPWLIKKPIFYFFYLVIAILFSYQGQYVKNDKS